MGDCELEAECESEVEPKPLVEGKGETEPERVPVALPLGEGDKEGTAEAEGDPELLGDCATAMLAASIKTRRRMAAGGQVGRCVFLGTAGGGAPRRGGLGGPQGLVTHGRAE